MPAQAGIQSRRCHCGDPNNLDSRFRGNDGIRQEEIYVTVVPNGGTKPKALLRTRQKMPRRWIPFFACRLCHREFAPKDLAVAIIRARTPVYPKMGDLTPKEER